MRSSLGGSIEGEPESPIVVREDVMRMSTSPGKPRNLEIIEQARQKKCRDN